MGEELQVEGRVSLKDSVDVIQNKSARIHVGYRNPVDYKLRCGIPVVCIKIQYGAQGSRNGIVGIFVA